MNNLPSVTKPTQAGFTRQFNESNREQFNPQLFARNDEDLVDSFTKILHSCENSSFFLFSHSFLIGLKLLQ